MWRRISSLALLIATATGAQTRPSTASGSEGGTLPKPAGQVLVRCELVRLPLPDDGCLGSHPTASVNADQWLRALWSAGSADEACEAGDRPRAQKHLMEAAALWRSQPRPRYELDLIPEDVEDLEEVDQTVSVGCSVLMASAARLAQRLGLAEIALEIFRAASVCQANQGGQIASEVNFGIAWTLLNLDRPLEARPLLERLLTELKDWEESESAPADLVMELAAHARDRTGDSVGARPLLEAILTSGLAVDRDVRIRRRLYLASVCMDLGDTEAAARQYEAALSDWPHQDDSLERVQSLIQLLDELSTAKADAGDLRAAVTLRTQAMELSLKLDPDPLVLMVDSAQLGLDRLTVGDLKGARAALAAVPMFLIRQLITGPPQAMSKEQREALAPFLRMAGMAERFTAMALQRLPTGTHRVDSRFFNAFLDRHPEIMEWLLEELEDVCVSMGRLDPAMAQSLALPPELLAGWEGHLAFESGDLIRAQALAEQQLAAVDAKGMPGDIADDDGSMLLAWVHARAARPHQARTSAERVIRTLEAEALSMVLAPRRLAERVEDCGDEVDLLASLAAGVGTLPPQEWVGSRLLVVGEALRARDLGASQLSRRLASGANAKDWSTLRENLARVTTRLAELEHARHGTIGANRAPAADPRPALVLQKEGIERAMLAAARASEASVAGAGLPSPATLAARLNPQSVAVSYFRFVHTRYDPALPTKRVQEPTLGALLLDHKAQVTYVPIAPAEQVDGVVGELMAAVGTDPLRGESLAPQDLERIARRLRRMIVDPVRARAPNARCMHLSLDDTLQLVPFDALPEEDGEHALGDRLELVHHQSLLGLLESRPPHDGPAILLAVGGLDYDRQPDPEAIQRWVPGVAATPPRGATRSGTPDNFVRLDATRDEVRRIGAYHDAEVGGSNSLVVVDRDVTKATLAELAPQARYIHIASHAYQGTGVTRRRDLGRPDPVRIETLSPMVLTGIALSGANLGPDSLGRVHGIMTAEEILALDLSRCELAVLSACSTSLGVRRAGQGYASLRAAFQGAGARAVVASLWKVRDELTSTLMVDFYRRLWVLKQTPQEALWRARRALRDQPGVNWRDWAGWVLSRE